MRSHPRFRSLGHQSQGRRRGRCARSAWAATAGPWFPPPAGTFTARPAGCVPWELLGFAHSVKLRSNLMIFQGFSCDTLLPWTKINLMVEKSEISDIVAGGARRRGQYGAQLCRHGPTPNFCQCLWYGENEKLLRRKIWSITLQTTTFRATSQLQAI